MGGEEGFRDLTAQLGLDRVVLPMGSNFGDLDNDGFLDIYLGTGNPRYSCLVPNVMFRNDAGRRFEDVTAATGTGHLQKGHGVAFADWDDDGDLDVFLESGGATPGDKAHNVLFQNPGHGNHWLTVRLVGTRTNRSAIGARIRVEAAGPDGASRLAPPDDLRRFELRRQPAGLHHRPRASRLDPRARGLVADRRDARSLSGGAR